jgi:hypothetical protein
MPYQKLRTQKSQQRGGRIKSQPSIISAMDPARQAEPRGETILKESKPVRINYIVKDLPLY